MWQAQWALTDTEAKKFSSTHRNGVYFVPGKGAYTGRLHFYQDGHHIATRYERLGLKERDWSFKETLPHSLALFLTETNWSTLLQSIGEEVA